MASKLNYDVVSDITTFLAKPSDVWNASRVSSTWMQGVASCEFHWISSDGCASYPRFAAFDDRNHLLKQRLEIDPLQPITFSTQQIMSAKKNNKKIKNVANVNLAMSRVTDEDLCDILPRFSLGIARLDLSLCTLVSPQGLGKALDALPMKGASKLRSLKLRHCKTLTGTKNSTIDLSVFNVASGKKKEKDDGAPKCSQGIEIICQRCTNLESLDLSWTSTTDADLKHIFQSLPKLTRLYIMQCPSISKASSIIEKYGGEPLTVDF